MTIEKMPADNRGDGPVNSTLDQMQYRSLLRTQPSISRSLFWIHAKRKSPDLIGTGYAGHTQSRKGQPGFNL
jgi:hypothetical protein